jgi:MoCo/4Fe-4S cofactor protein with predicted Tat translocation signal
MKTIPPVLPEPETGRTYWRSLDELAETPEFRQWVEREFPAGASEWTDPVSRRHFVKIMSASFLLGGLGFAGSGCRRPVERIFPFSKMPENYVHGVPQYYATAMPTRGSAIPLVVKSTDGRPIKIEGNALHPDSNGGTDRFAQASILNLYDPDRATRFTSGGNSTSPAAALGFLDSLAKKAQSNGGQGLSFLLEQNNSPSRARLQKMIADELPQARWYAYEPVDLDISRRAASLAFGQSVRPHYHFDAAKVIVSLDCDFIGSEEDAHNNIRRFAAGRQIEKPEDSLNRLYVVESLMSLTGINADHRLRLASSAVVQVAAGLVAEILKTGGDLAGLGSLGTLAGDDAKWVAECAKDLLQNRGQSLVVAGYRQPLAVHMLAHALNDALGNLGQTVVFREAPESREGSITELAKALNAGQVETLVILGGNPVYTAPADLDWASTQGKAKTVVRLGYYEDETFPHCQWHFPAAHFLESWGDALTGDGTLVPLQPLIAPLFGGLTELEMLARIGAAAVGSPYAIAGETFAGFLKVGDREAAWKKFLHDGFLANSATRPVEVSLNHAAVSEAIAGMKKAAAPGANNLEAVFYRDYKVDDGRYNNNGWLQELPDPVTKVVWDNAVLLSRKTAQELGVKNLEVVEIKLGERTVRGPIWVQPGMADYSLGLALGYGRKQTGRVGLGTGFDAYPLRTSEAANFAMGATLRSVGETYSLSCTQTHWSMEGRPIIREANLDQYREHPGFAKSLDEEKPPVEAPLYPNPFDQIYKPKGLHQWGMSIDLNRCVGCSACMMACQSENNVPIVGKDQVHRGREMHWIRIDRYYAGRPLVKAGTPEASKDFFETFEKESDQQFQDWIDNPQVVTQPMLCQHCEAAPCENVCPVNATSHDEEGLNVMTYNRCVGTRYCSNNCPYKVRRFNFFDFNKRPIGQFYRGPFGQRREDEWDLLKMVKNPDVTVRMRGVMEKCTFCIQRIQQAKIAQKTKAGASGDVIIPTDSFTTACAQACPAGAIVFGNIKDPESRVSKLKKLTRDYSVLEMLLTKPRLTYLARVRNPNHAMPDYHADPFSLQEYEQKSGNEHPFEREPEPAAEKGAQ